VRLAADGTLRLSPSDLANHLACPHLTQLAAAFQRGEIPPPPERENAHAELIARKGEEHEAAFLAALLEQGREVVEIELGDDGLEAAARRTEAALRAGVEVVYQGVLASGGWRGLADFLVRTREPSELGSFSYEAWDTKLARSAKPNAVLQLTFYSHELERIQGLLPERMRVARRYCRASSEASARRGRLRHRSRGEQRAVKPETRTVTQASSAAKDTAISI